MQAYIYVSMKWRGHHVHIEVYRPWRVCQGMSPGLQVYVAALICTSVCSFVNDQLHRNPRRTPHSQTITNNQLLYTFFPLLTKLIAAHERLKAYGHRDNVGRSSRSRWWGPRWTWSKRRQRQSLPRRRHTRQIPWPRFDDAISIAAARLCPRGCSSARWSQCARRPGYSKQHPRARIQQDVSSSISRISERSAGGPRMQSTLMATTRLHSHREAVYIGETDIWPALWQLLTFFSDHSPAVRSIRHLTLISSQPIL
jgi:hypothetical protein